MSNSEIEDEKWIVLFGNGYDSTNGKAVLFILKPKTGEIIKKLSAVNPTVGSENGLSSPTAVDVNFDQKVDFVYAGDLYGNVWKFDLTGKNSATWKLAFSDGTYKQPLFQARGPGGSIQPITAKPEVMAHPEKHGLMVLFGTGKLLGTSDLADKQPQSVYGIWDYGDRAYYPGEWGNYSNDDDSEYLGTFTRPYLSNQSLNSSLLKQNSEPHRVFDADGNDVTLRVMSNDDPTWITSKDHDPQGLRGEPNLPNLEDDTANHVGWYYDLPLDGERVVSDVLLRDGKLIVICFTPHPDHCSEGGTSFIMELNAFTGGRSNEVVFDFNGDGAVDEHDEITIGYDEDGEPVKVPPSGIKAVGNIQPPAILRLNNSIKVKYLTSSTGKIYTLNEKAEKTGVTYWQELEQR
jgi:type IV pilus assembly protein PilY1